MREATKENTIETDSQPERARPDTSARKKSTVSDRRPALAELSVNADNNNSSASHPSKHYTLTNTHDNDLASKPQQIEHSIPSKRFKSDFTRITTDSKPELFYDSDSDIDYCTSDKENDIEEIEYQRFKAYMTELNPPSKGHFGKAMYHVNEGLRGLPDI